MHILAIVNQKGGVGKTTTAVNLAACLARANRSVLLIDLDQQTNATQHLACERPQDVNKTSHALLVESKPDAAALIQPIAPNLAMIPAHIALAEVDLRLAAAVNPDGRLRRALAPLEGQYDFCILDCPPAIGRSTLNALVAATHLIVVVETAWFAYEAVERLITIVDDVIEQSNPGLEVYALATKRRPNVRLDAAVLDRVREVFQERAFETVVRHTVAFSEAAMAGQSIVDYASGSGGHQDYQKIAKEVIERVEAQTRSSALTA